jgi:hypothetical protein
MRRSNGFSCFAMFVVALMAIGWLTPIAQATIFTVNGVSVTVSGSPTTVAQGVTDVLTANGSGTPSSQNELVPGTAAWTFSANVQVQQSGSWVTADPSTYSLGAWSGSGSAQQTANITFSSPGTYKINVGGSVTYPAKNQSDGSNDPNDSWGGSSSGTCQIQVVPIIVTISGPTSVALYDGPQYTATAIGATGNFPTYSWTSLGWDQPLQGPWSNGGDPANTEHYTGQNVGSTNITCTVTGQRGAPTGTSSPYSVTVHN